jgi:TP901 family phage tail tape measure protein
VNRVAERTVKLRVGMDISGLVSQARAATAAMADFSKKSVSYIEKNSSSINDLSSKVGGVGIGLTALATAAVTRFAQFDKAMSSVAATGADARGSIDALRAAAIDAGADTAFSAEEAANAIEELAKAGLSAKDILGGGLDGALSLAAAGGLEVAAAAEIAATALTQFSLSGADVPHVADLLAAGAGKAQGSVSDMSAALNQAGLIASQTGLSIEETTAGLSAFASAGLLGSDAGTSFKTMLQVLAAPSSTAAAEMERLGIDAYNAQGEFIGLQGVAGNLRESLAGLTDEQKSAALATIFGSDAVRAASVLYNQGAVGVATWTHAVNETGYAAETARVQTDNLIGDLERLGGSIDSVFIQSGTGANTALRGIVQGAEAAVDAIGQLPEPLLDATTMIAGAGGLSLLGIAGLAKLAVSAGEVTSALKEMNIPLKNAAIAAGGLGVVLGGVGIGLSIMAQRAAEAQGRVAQLSQTWTDAGKATNATTNLITEALTKQTDNMVDGNKTLIELADQVGVATTDLVGYITGEEDAIGRVNAKIEEHGELNDLWLSKSLGQQTEAQNLSKELGDLSNQYTRSKEVNDLAAQAQEAATGSTAGLAEASSDAAGAVGDLSEAIEDQWQAMMDASGAVLSLRDAQRQAEASYDDAREALKDNGRTLDQATAKGRANQSALDSIASSGYDLVDSLRSQGASLKDIQAAMAQTRQRYIETARSMGMSSEAANRLADSIGLIPKNVSTTATVNTGSAMAQVTSLWNTLQSIDGKTVTASVAIKRYGQAALATGGRVPLPGFPTGGRLPGSPPANPLADNLLGVDGSGMPRVRVRSREWVVNQPASDYYGDGLMGAINSRAIPREALAGLAGLAGGGAIGSAQDAVNYWWGQVADARDGLRSARRRKSERAEQQAEARLDRAQEKLDVAQERRDRLREEAADLRTSLRRGDIRDSVTGGLSGAYSTVDELRSMAAGGDLGGARSRRLRMVANVAERELESLYSAAERAEKKVADTKDRLDELLQVQAGVRSSIVGGFGMSDVTGAFDEKTGKRVASGSQLAAAAKAYAGKARAFAGLLGQLGAKGGSAAIVQEVAGYGVEAGMPLAQSLLADLGSLRSLSASYADIEKYGGWAGANVARAVGGGRGIGEAARDAQVAEAQVNAIDKRIGSWAKTIGREQAKALGIGHRASGGSMVPGGAYITGELGRELVLPQSPQYVLTADATRRLATASSRGGYGATASPTYNDNSLSVTTNQHVSERTLLRFDQKRQLLRGRS